MKRFAIALTAAAISMTQANADKVCDDLTAFAADYTTEKLPLTLGKTSTVVAVNAYCNYKTIQYGIMMHTEEGSTMANDPDWKRSLQAQRAINLVSYCAEGEDTHDFYQNGWNLQWVYYNTKAERLGMITLKLADCK